MTNGSHASINVNDDIGTRTRSSYADIILDLFEGVEPAYLSKPTIIMCNPNALIY